ncbi:MAG: orotate phosphoribosyltransferase [Fimbriimonadaceae bacterium]|jgi:orotate phosphoribosyltransferase|nr:orotate phosphoribosyltransferase [Fimbriimonadaceae bacterium]
MSKEAGVDLSKLLEESGAVLHGHFLLTSGRHSDVYFEKFRVLEQPQVLSALCREIAQHCGFSNPKSKTQNPKSEVDLVAGPTTGGIIIAFEVARQMSLPAIYIETEDGQKKLRRGARIPPGSRVLIVDDVLTTGTSTREVLDVITEAGGVPAGVAVLIDRTEAPLDFGVPLFAAHKVEAQSFAPHEVPDWLDAIPITKPGTRR